MRRNFVPQVAYFSAPARFGQAIAHLSQLLNQRVDLHLLAVDLRVELIQQVFGKTCLDFQVDEAFSIGLGISMGCIGHDFGQGSDVLYNFSSPSYLNYLQGDS